MVLFQLIKFHQFLVYKCFCLHDILSQTNHHQSLSLLRLFFFFSSCVSFVKSIFVCETFSICFFFFLLSVVFFRLSVMLCKPCFHFIFRNNVSFKTVSGESKAFTPEMFAGWDEMTLPTLLSNYGLENIYNANELGLFYRCLPDKFYQLKTE